MWNGIITSILENKFPRNKIIGLDNDLNCIEYCLQEKEKNKFLNTNFIQANIENIPIEKETINNIISRCSLMYVHNKKAALSEFYRILQDNSIISLFESVLPLKNYRFYKHINKKKLQIIPHFEILRRK